VSRASQRSQRSQHVAIDLPRVGLSSDGVGEGESKKLGDPLVESLDLSVISIEESEEGSLSSGGSLDSSESEISSGSSEVSKIPEEFLRTKERSLAVGREEGRREKIKESGASPGARG